LKAGVTDRMVSLMDLGPTVMSMAGIPAPRYMQGQAFLGAHAKPPREFCFMARDRMDETYDLIRSVRDKRFRYIRNYQWEKPYAQKIAYMDEMPTMQEWRRLAAEGKLTGPQKLHFRPTKPKEELFDSVADPHEVQDLSLDPKYAKEMARLRTLHDRFMRDTNDLGLIPEDQLKERMRPGGKMAKTAAPALTAAGDLVAATCSTPGASIAWSVEGKRWKLYVKPVARAAGLRFKACRLGYEDSVVVMA
jgi:arylsulfatase A-like enzyme